VTLKRQWYYLSLMSILFVSLLGMAMKAQAAQVGLAWDADSSPAVTGYKLYYGPASRNYSNSIDVGNSTGYVVSNLIAGTNYYFATTAYGPSGESSYSNEVSYMLPAPPPPPGVPVANFTVNPSSGQAPLTVQFDDASTGSPTTWAWDFGDGITSDLQSPSHIYTLTGTFNAKLTAGNASGSSSKTLSIAVTEVPPPQPPPPPPPPPSQSFLSYGEIMADSNWQRITFSRVFNKPVVVAKALSYNNTSQAVVRIRNVDSTGFDICVQNYLDGLHSQEEVSYLVMDAGNYMLADGTRIEAGAISTNTKSFKTFYFHQAFKVVPVLITSISTYNEADTVTNRLKAINKKRFKFRLQEQGSIKSQRHTYESINYIAWEPSAGTKDGWDFQVSKTNSINSQFKYVPFAQPFLSIPSFIADIQTANENGSAAELRWQNKDQFGVQVKIEESDNTAHRRESIGCMVFAPTIQ
jgi:PKD repeat protein